MSESLDEHAEVERLQRRLARERRIRKEAEAIAERVTGDLYASLQELDRLNKNLETTNQELEAANQAIRDFVSVASHDLRGPLASILGYVTMMQQRWTRFDDERRLEFLAVVERQGTRLNRLVEDLLTVSKIEAGAVEARIEEISISRMLEEVVHEMGERSEGVVLSLDATELRVLADPDHLSRIVINYLTNALKYGQPPIEAICKDGGDWAEIRICDQGAGVPTEFVPRLFERFARAEDEVTLANEGTGLGLSIVRGLARANGGDAWYEPNMPRGSCFAVRFPKAS